MFSFELKTVIAAGPEKVFAALTDPQYLTQWDYCRWVQNDYRLGGKVRKRDEDMRLFEGEIVIFEPPFRYGVVWPLLVNTEDEEDGRFPVRFEYALDAHEQQTALTLRAEGFPTEDLCERERNTWGGYFLEKLKKVVEQTKKG